MADMGARRHRPGLFLVVVLRRFTTSSCSIHGDMLPVTVSVALLLFVRAAASECTVEDLVNDVTHTIPDKKVADKTYGDEEQAEYICGPGHFNSGNGPPFRIATCDNGVWTYPADDLRCRPVNCGHPGDIKNGRMVGSVFTFPNTISYQCYEGFRIKGRENLFCQSDGKWDSEARPLCEPVQCPTLVNPAKGKIESIERHYGGVLRYACNDGAKATGGDLERRCEADGSWSGKEVICEGITCSEPIPPKHGSFNGDERGVGASVTYLCENSDNSVQSVCLPEGVWDRDPPVCPPAAVAPTMESSMNATVSSGSILWSLSDVIVTIALCAMCLVV